MKLDTTETYLRTIRVYHDKLSKKEYHERLLKHIKDKLPGVPSKYRYRQIVSMGGSRSSKTYSILQMLMVEMITRKNIKITVWRDTKVTCRATIMDDFKQIIMFHERTYSKFKENKQTGTFTYMPTKSRIIFEGADSIGKVLGGAQDISYFNEVTQFSKAVYLQITQRTSDRVLADYNPHEDFWLESYRLDPDTVFIHSTFEHNAFCPPNIVKQLLSYEPWERGSYKVVGSEIFHNGKPIDNNNRPPINALNYERGTADEYMWLVYGLGIGAEKPYRIYKGWRKIMHHEFESLEYTSYFGLDFGSSSPTAIVEVKYDGDGGFYVCPRFYQPLGEITESINTIIKTRVPQIKCGTSLIVGDSAKQTYIDMLIEGGHLIVPAIKGGGSVNARISLIKGFTIYYVPEENFENEYQNYSWHIDRYDKPTDQPVKENDHYMDAVGYIIAYLVKFLHIKI